MNRSLKLVFVASLLLNILLAGIILGHASRYAMREREKHPEMVLAEKERVHFLETVRLIEQRMDGMRGQLDKERARAADLLKADPFDSKAYKNQVDKMSVARAEMMLQLSDLIASRAAEASPAERALMADRLRKPPMRKTAH